MYSVPLTGPGYPPPGTVVSVAAYLFWRHTGIVSDRWYGGKPMVISASARTGRVCEEPWDVFADGVQVRNDGYPSTLAPYTVLLRARLLIGKPYHPVAWNCEHMVAVAHGRPPESPQLATTFMLALTATLGIVAARSR